jgi:hypothetical protein
MNQGSDHFGNQREVCNLRVKRVAWFTSAAEQEKPLRGHKFFNALQGQTTICMQKAGHTRLENSSWESWKSEVFLLTMSQISHTIFSEIDRPQLGSEPRPYRTR